MNRPETPQARKRRVALLALGLAVTAALFYCLNLLTPLFADDYNYLFSCAQPGQRIRTLADILPSQLVHYRETNGRAVVHSFVQLWLMVGKPAFNVANTAVFLLLGLAVYYAGFGTFHRLRHIPLLLAYVLLWLSMLQFGQSCLWLTGACNYMHVALATLCFLLPYRSDREEKPGVWRAVLRAALLLVAGVVVGWLSEQAAVAAVAGAVLFGARRRLLGKGLKPWMFAGLLGALAGFALLMLSPGQAHRIAGNGGLFDLRRMGVSVLRTCYYTVRDLWIPAVPGLALLVCSIRQGRGSGFLCWLKRHSVAVVWLLLAAASIFCMVVVLYFPWRAFCLPAALVACGLLAASDSVALPAIPRRWQAAALCAVLAACLVTYGVAVRDIARSNRCWQQREADILAQKAAGAAEYSACTVRGYTRWNCYVHDGDLVEDPAGWQNLMLQLYYDVGPISLREGEYPG